MKPLNEVKQEQKPLKRITFFELIIFLEITNPYRKEPIQDTMKILFK